MDRKWILVVGLLILSACAEREGSPFDPASDRTPPSLTSLVVTNEEAPGAPGTVHTFVDWVASEPVRVVAEYGANATELLRHSYRIDRGYETSGRIKLVAAETGQSYALVMRFWDRAGNESILEQEDPVLSEIQALDDLFLLAMIDVGWGDALYMEAPDGTNTLVDAGHPADAAPVREFLLNRGITALDFASLSHVHNDHIGGFYGDDFGGIDGLIQGNGGSSPLFPIGTFLDIEDKTVETTGPYNDLLEALNATSTNHEFLLWGASSDDTPALRWGDGVRVDLLAAGRKDFLLPDHIVDAEEGSVINNDSMIYRVQFGSFVAILMGDGEFATEQFLQNNHSREFLQATVLKLGHHGANDANGERFINVVDPQIALVTNAVSENPGVQHPFVLQRLRNRSIEYYASDRVIPNRDRALPGVRGDVLVWTDGAYLTVEVQGLRFE